jgi:hypothetical protein
MLAVGGWLMVVGVCDLLRAARDTTSWTRRALIAALGVVLLVMLGLMLDLGGEDWLGLGGIMVVSLVVWVLASSVAVEQGPAASPAALTLAFGALTVGLAGTVVGGGVAADSLQDMPASLGGSLVQHLSPDELVLLAGVVAVQLSTSNILVRLVLDAVGIPPTTNEKQLKGGRLLGPMERLFIVGLGLAGQLTAAAVVVAAKGLLRFPELQRGVGREQQAVGVALDGPSDVTEYFLIGSFASWLLALGGLALLVL